MSPCRTLLTMYALSLAFGCMLGLVIANRILMALDDERRRAREAMPRDIETDWLVADTAEHPLVFERDVSETVWSVN